MLKKRMTTEKSGKENRSQDLPEISKKVEKCSSTQCLIEERLLKDVILLP